MNNDKTYRPILSPLYHDEGASSLVEPKRKAGPLVLLLGGLALVLTVGFLVYQLGRNRDEQHSFSSGQSQVEVMPPPSLPAEQTIAPRALGNDLGSESASGKRVDNDAERLKLEALEQARQEEAERQRKRQELEEQKMLDRYRSPMIVSEVLSEGIAPIDQRREGDGGPTFQETNANAQFMASRANAKVEVAKAERLSRPDATIIQGTIIKGVLETAVNTDLPGMVRAVTTEDVWSYDGRRVLLPAGSRLVGEYNSGLQNGQKRFFVVWSRIIRPDGISVQVGSYGTDDLGRSGLSGNLDNHYFERFGGAFLMSFIAAGAQVAAATATTNAYPEEITTSRVNPVTGQIEQITYRDRAAQNTQVATKGITALAQSIGGTAQELFKGNAAIPPTITVDQGAEIAVSVRRDLDFSAFYPDPVVLKLRELRRNVVKK